MLYSIWRLTTYSVSIWNIFSTFSAKHDHSLSSENGRSNPTVVPTKEIRNKRLHRPQVCVAVAVKTCKGEVRSSNICWGNGYPDWGLSWISSFPPGKLRDGAPIRPKQFFPDPLTLILPRSSTGTVWFYTSTSNKRAARPKLYTKTLTRDLKRMYSRFTLVRISINL